MCKISCILHWILENEVCNYGWIQRIWQNINILWYYYDCRRRAIFIRQQDSIYRKASRGHCHSKKNIQLYTPEYALEEIDKYREEIRRKTKITQEEFKEIRKELKIRIDFIALGEYQDFLKEIKLTKEITQRENEEILNDIDFLALAIKFNYPLWSNDHLLKKQKQVAIITTKEIIEILDET